MFKDKFKYYKKKVPPSSLQNILNVRTDNNDIISKFHLRGRNEALVDEHANFGLQHPSLWKAVELKNHPGLIFIVNPFTNNGQRYWIARSVADYSTKPNLTNISQLPDLCNLLGDKSWWDLASCEVNHDKNSISRKMRWATMGYHHNWDTKVYSEEAKSPFPADLDKMSRYIVKIALNVDFVPEAAIVNFYLMDSFLSGHVDRSELNTSAPLVSLSFGQTAVFLLGGETITTEPDAILLESGDIILMTGKSRLQYHGVPKIIPTEMENWNDFSDADSYSADELTEKFNHITLSRVENRAFWASFARYIGQARVNLNVRQVNYHDFTT
ncbi:hypothetical protein V9T40_008544 [Parthenolecanium corni]|uniref:Fe2OG dioxygenase domain-containing protein n=1 Tax=Parthenolecanium corni TaxID=536013 RepID=A0AAN9U017_9HEMI